MPQTALDLTALDRLRGTSSLASQFTGRVRISAKPATTVFNAQVNQSTFANSFAQISVDNEFGSLSNVVVGMRVMLSRTNDKTAAYWSGRVRKTPADPIIYINETSVDVHDNDYLWILNDYLITDKLARLSSGVQLNDYDLTFRQLLPVVYNLNTVYAGDIDGGTSKLTIAFAPSALATTSGASISSWLWAIDGTSTITVGSTSTQNVTIAFDEGHHWLHLTVTDSGSRSITRHIEIHAHGSTYTYQLVAVDSVQRSWPVGSGADVTLTAYVAPTNLLDLTQVTIWSDDSDQTGSGSISGDNILFVGRIRTRENTTATSDQNGLDKTANYTVEGPLTQLARTEQLPYEMLRVQSPTKWGDIKDLTIWRGIVYLLSEYSTFLNLHSLQFDSSDNTYIAPTRNPKGDILAAVNDLAFSINAALQIDGAGRAEVVRHASMLETTSLRNALVTKATVLAGDLTSITIKQDAARPVGLLTASAGSFNTTTGIYTVTEARSPGTAPAEGSQTANLDRQVLPANLSQAAADAKLIQRANNAFEKAQGPDEITAIFKPQWHSVLLPSLNTWWSFDLDAGLTVDGAVTNSTKITSSIRWLLTSLDTGYNAEGIPEVKGTFVRETSGINKGFTVVYPAPTPNSVPTVPTVPSIPMFPVPPISLPDNPTGDSVPAFPPGTVTLTLPLDGNCAILGGDKGGEQSLKITTTMVVLPTPYTREIVPNDLTATEVIKHAIFNPYGPTPKGAYLLTYDTGMKASRVRYTEDFSAYPVSYTTGDWVDGEYSELKIVYQGTGKIIMLGKVFTPGGCADDWGIITGTETSRTADTITADAVFAGGAWRIGISATGYYGGPHPPSGFCRHLALSRTPGGSIGFWVCGFDTETIATYAGGCIYSMDYTDSVPFSCTFTLTDDSGCGDCGGTNTYYTSYSSDFGATFATAVDTGGANIAIDTAKASGKALVVGAGQTRIDDTGGAWSDYGSAKPGSAVYVPRYQFSPSTTSNSSSTPQYLLFAPALDSGAALWKVTSSGAAFADKTPVDGSSNKGLATGPRCTNIHWLNSAHWLVLGLFGTDVKLAVTLNGGGVWHFPSSALDPAASNIVTQRGDHTQKQAWFINGSQIGYVKNYQASTPVVLPRVFDFDHIVSLDIYG